MRLIRIDSKCTQCTHRSKVFWVSAQCATRRSCSSRAREARRPKSSTSRTRKRTVVGHASTTSCSSRQREHRCATSRSPQHSSPNTRPRWRRVRRSSCSSSARREWLSARTGIRDGVCEDAADADAEAEAGADRGVASAAASAAVDEVDGSCAADSSISTHWSPSSLKNDRNS